MKAAAIFEQKGLLKLLKEVKQKLKLLNPQRFNQMMNENGGNAAQLLGVGPTSTNIESDMDDGLGDVASPEQMNVRHKGKLVAPGAAKKKKNSSKQRKPINNYMSDNK